MTEQTAKEPDAPKTPRFSRAQVQRTKRLLDMLYKPSEIADEMRIDIRTMYRVYIPAGCPSSKDATDNIWIPGKKFAVWVDSVSRASSRAIMTQKTGFSKDQAYCVHCRHRVLILNMVSERLTNTRGPVKVTGSCSECGGKVSKFARAGDE